VDLQSLLETVMKLDREVTEMRHGDPRLCEVAARIDEIENQVQEQRGLAQPLVPDAKRPSSLEEDTADNLERALRSLRSAAASKR
jgi:hypothetical protein